MLTLYLSMLDNEDEKNKFQEIYENNYKVMLWKANQILQDSYLAEDAVHDSFLRLIKCKDSYFKLPADEIRGVCIVITKHRCTDMLADRKGEVTTDYQDEREENGREVQKMPVEETVRGILDQVIQKEQQSMLAELIRHLPERYSSVLSLHYGMELSCKEIAGLLGISTHTVEMRLTRGRTKFRQVLGEEMRND